MLTRKLKAPYGLSRVAMDVERTRSPAIACKVVDGEPLGVCNFEVDVGGVIMGFSQVSGLGYEPELQQVTAVTLRRAAGRDLAVWAWARDPQPPHGDRDAPRRAARAGMRLRAQAGAPGQVDWTRTRRDVTRSCDGGVGADRRRSGGPPHPESYRRLTSHRRRRRT